MGPNIHWIGDTAHIVDPCCIMNVYYSFASEHTLVHFAVHFSSAVLWHASENISDQI